VTVHFLLFLLFFIAWRKCPSVDRKHFFLLWFRHHVAVICYFLLVNGARTHGRNVNVCVWSGLSCACDAFLGCNPLISVYLVCVCFFSAVSCVVVSSHA